MTEANKITVSGYLRRCFHVTDEQIAEALNVPENQKDLETGQSFRSNADYVGDQIAARQGWEFDEAAYDEWVEDHEED